MGTTGKYSLDDILYEVCDYYNVSVDDVYGRGRYRDLGRARSMYVRIANDLTTYGPVAIGLLIERDHATTIHYKTKMDYMNPDEVKEHTEILNLLGSDRTDPESQLKCFSNLGKAYFYTKNIDKIPDNR